MTGAPLGEFDVIARYFAGLGARRGDVRLGIGDDAAVVEAPGVPLATALVTVIAPGPPRAAGAGAVDALARALVAAGAEPAWATLALTLSEIDPDWLAAFSTGLGERLEAHGMALIGGDTTRGPLAFTLVAHGATVP